MNTCPSYNYRDINCCIDVVATGTQGVSVTFFDPLLQVTETQICTYIDYGVKFR